MENKRTVTVFGATGKVGSKLLNFLSQANVSTIAVTRNKSKVETMPSVEWVEADMDSKESLYKTMADSQSVFLSSSMGERFIEAQGNVIEAAMAQGVAHIVKLSSGAADNASPLYIARAHGEVEEALKASGITGTILRPNGFMQNWLGSPARTVKKERRIYEATGDGKRAYIDIRDIAEVAFNVLMAPDNHACHGYSLTGSEAVNYTQVAAVISRVIGERVEYVALTPGEAKERMEQSGMPGWAIQTLLAYEEDQRSGKAAYVSGDVGDILQRPARTMEAFIKEHAECFR